MNFVNFQLIIDVAQFVAKNLTKMFKSSGAVQKRGNIVDLVMSFQTKSNEYVLAKFGFDTAKNEPEYGYGISLIFVSLIFGPACTN